MNIFEQASRQALRFPSVRGLLTTEQLWELPLQSKTGFDLDSVAKAVNRELKATAEESFVTTTSPANTRTALMLDVVKHVIATRLAENEANRTAAARREEREKLLAILAQKNDEELKGMSRADIEKRLSELAA